MSVNEGPGNEQQQSDPYAGGYPQAGRGRRTPPPVPPNWPRRKPAEPEMFSKLGEQFEAMDKKVSALSLVDGLLKTPGRVAYEIVKGRNAQALGALLVIVVVCMTGYGLVVGTFSGGCQLSVVPLKVVIGCLLSGLICLPSLYIFSCLSGGKQTFGQTAGLLLALLALSGILLVGFAPIAWIFSQSTNAETFMGFLHIVFWGIGTYFSIRLLHAALSFLNERRMDVINLWAVIFVMVAMQMCTTLRPLVGPWSGTAVFQEKKFFVAHWVECLKGGRDYPRIGHPRSRGW